MSPHLSTLTLFVAAAPSSVRESLIARSDRRFFGLVLSSVVVGIGVVLEAPEETREIKRWWRLWRLGKTRNLLKPLGYVGLVLVVLGVAGEGVFEWLGANAETQIRDFDSARIAAAQNGEQDALRAAREAAISSKQGLDSAKDALQKAGQAQELAARDEKNAAKLAKDILRTGPRSWLLYGENQREFVSALKPFAGQRMEVRYCSYDIPSAPFGTDRELTSLVLMLNGLIQSNAHWHTQAITGNKDACAGTGVWVNTDPSAPPETNRAAEALIDQLAKLGLSGRVVTHDLNTRFPSDTITLSIQPHL